MGVTVDRSISLECPFCGSFGWTDTADRLAHVLETHDLTLFAARSVLRDFEAEGLSWDTYHGWLVDSRSQRPGLGR